MTLKRTEKRLKDVSEGLQNNLVVLTDDQLLTQVNSVE